MIPMIWLINIFLINHWFMDGWPGWKLVPNEMAVHEPVEEMHWSQRYGLGLLTGTALGVALYFAVVASLPILTNLIKVE